MIIADSREPDNPFDSEELPAGDYVIANGNGGLIIERKTWTDLVNSVRSGKIYQQLRMCKEQEGYRVILLIEGSRSNALRYANSSHNELRRFISSIIAKMPEIYMAQTISKSETFEFIMDLDDWLGDDDAVHRIREAEKVPPSKRSQYIIEGLPNVGPKMAVRLLDHFGDVQSVINADKSDLQEVDGVGPKTAEGIIGSVRAD